MGFTLWKSIMKSKTKLFDESEAGSANSLLNRLAACALKNISKSIARGKARMEV